MMKEFIQIPNMENNMCFGCGPANSNGLQMKFYGNDDLVYSEISVPETYIGWQNVVHGGIVSTLLDEIMSWSAIFLNRRFILTKSMTVNYHKPVMAGDKLRVEGSIENRVSERECIMSGKLFNSKNELSASSTGIFALFTIDSMRKLGFMSDEGLSEFQAIIDSHV
ncbi:MAG TPA: PaaI family thioesterase [Spirochaetota bacterium]|nr:PaaI family thioesterase [Spirochaetota bacterium]